LILYFYEVRNKDNLMYLSHEHKYSTEEFKEIVDKCLSKIKLLKSNNEFSDMIDMLVKEFGFEKHEIGFKACEDY